MSADQKVAGGVPVLHGRPPKREAEKICFPEARGRSRGDRTPYHGRPPGFLKNRSWTPEGGGRPQGDRTPRTVDRLAMKSLFHVSYVLSCFHMCFYMLIHLFVYMSTCYTICLCCLPGLNCF